MQINKLEMICQFIYVLGFRDASKKQQIFAAKNKLELVCFDVSIFTNSIVSFIIDVMFRAISLDR